MASRFAAQGATVSFIDIDVAGGAATAASTGAEFIACDITEIAALRSAIAAVDGPIAVLVNNAARDDRHVMADVEPATLWPMWSPRRGGAR